MSSYRIPFNKPGLVGDELSFIADAILKGHIAGDGEYTARYHAFLQEKLGCSRALLTTSCTHALEMAALLLDIQPGNEVIVPSFTFVSTANAFALRRQTEYTGWSGLARLWHCRWRVPSWLLALKFHDIIIECRPR